MEKMEGDLKDFFFLLGQKVLSEIKKENEGSGEALGCFEFLFEHKWTRGDPVIWRRDFLRLLRSINASEDVEVGAKCEFVRGMIEKCGRKTIRSNQVAYQVSTIYDSFLEKLQKRLRSIIPTIYDQMFLLQLQVARKGCEYWDTKFGNIGYNLEEENAPFLGVRLNPEDRRVYVKENGPPRFLTLKLLDFDDVHEVAEEKDINKRNQEIVDLYNGDKKWFSFSGYEGKKEILLSPLVGTFSTIFDVVVLKFFETTVWRLAQQNDGFNLYPDRGTKGFGTTEAILNHIRAKIPQSEYRRRRRDSGRLFRAQL